METWFIIILTLCIAALMKSIFNHLSPTTTATPKLNLPPGPPTVPVLGSFLWLKKSFSELEPLLRSLHSKYGPMVTLHIGSQAAIFVSDRAIAHTALVQHGSVFSDRPSAGATSKIISSNQHNISSAAYGPTWRLLRRNLTAEILHPARIKSYVRARKMVLEILIERLHTEAKDGVRVADHFQYAMFCLLVFMCFGDGVEETAIRSVERVQRDLLLGFGRFNVLNFWPWIGRFVFRKRWEELIRLRKNQEDVLVPLIRARKQLKNESNSEEDDQNPFVLSYVDTLLELNLPEEKRKLDEDEIVTLCSEFLNAGTDTTSTALQWIMANLVKNPKIQKKLTEEINGVLGTANSDEVDEEDLNKMTYLKAVILEGLRRHPPGHFVLPHSVTENVELNGYLIPKNGNLNFMVAEMGWDPKVWEDPMEFRPERFLVNSDDAVFDLTCSREIKMMPFGAGRRMCPASGLAMLHLEYFVANLVRRFEWTAVDGDEVDLSEKQEFTVVMKNPLRANLSPRFESIPVS